MTFEGSMLEANVKHAAWGRNPGRWLNTLPVSINEKKK